MNHGVDRSFSQSPSADEWSIKSTHHFGMKGFWFGSTPAIEDAYVGKQLLSRWQLILSVEVCQPKNGSRSGTGDSVFTQPLRCVRRVKGLNHQ